MMAMFFAQRVILGKTEFKEKLLEDAGLGDLAVE